MGRYMHAILGPLLLLLTLMFYAGLPAEINNTSGFRTELSKSSQEAWDEAQIHSIKRMFMAAILTCLYQIVSIITMGPKNSFITSLIVFVFLIIALGPLTQHHLRIYLDKQEKTTRGATLIWMKYFEENNKYTDTMSV
ncbi:hypothetical protein ES708_12293 [subsurface metagenome]